MTYGPFAELWSWQSAGDMLPHPAATTATVEMRVMRTVRLMVLGFLSRAFIRRSPAG
jgi:hypothetical protein